MSAYNSIYEHAQHYRDGGGGDDDDGNAATHIVMNDHYDILQNMFDAVQLISLCIKTNKNGCRETETELESNAQH